MQSEFSFKAATMVGRENLQLFLLCDVRSKPIYDVITWGKKKALPITTDEGGAACARQRRNVLFATRSKSFTERQVMQPFQYPP